MNLFEFMSDSPWLAFFLAYLGVMVLAKAAQLIFKGFNRIVRHFNIRKCGWPPLHCDADGDFRDAVDYDELIRLISDVEDATNTEGCEFCAVVGGEELNALFEAAGLDKRVTQQKGRL